MQYNNATDEQIMSTDVGCFPFANETAILPQYDTNTTDEGPLQQLSLTNTTADGPLQQFYNIANCSLFNNSSNTTTLDSNSTSPPACYPDQEYFSISYKLVGTFFQSIIFVVGVLGNVLTCTVVSRTQSMRTTTNCYLGITVSKY